LGVDVGEEDAEKSPALEAVGELEDAEFGDDEVDITLERGIDVVQLEYDDALWELLEGGADVKDADALALEKGPDEFDTELPEDDAGALEDDREAVEEADRKVLDSAERGEATLEAERADTPSLVLDGDSEPVIVLEGWRDGGLEFEPGVADGDVGAPPADADGNTTVEVGKGDVFMGADTPVSIALKVALLSVIWVCDGSAMSDANPTARKE
jgi:hypothetical protein